MNAGSFYKKRTPIAKKGKSNFSKTFAECKRVFQLYIRIKAADHNGMVKCVHGAILHYSKCDAGHFVPAERKSTCFEEMNVNAQEKVKNMQMHDPFVNHQYRLFMIKKYGEQAVEDLILRSHLVKIYSIVELEEMTKDYNKKIEEIKNKLNI